MNKFKKFLIGLMIAAGAACLGGAAACNGSDGNTNDIPTDPPAYYQLDLKGSGIDIVFDGELAGTDDNGESFKFGGTVKEGVEVRFKVLLGANTTGTPVISVNQTLLTPDADGFYSFIMEKNSEISVTGLSALHTLKFSRFEEVIGSDGNGKLEERRIKFYDETGTRELDEEVTVTGGEDFRFKIWTSPYYNDEFTVSCGFEELVKDDKGVYTVQEVGESGEVNVTGLTLQESFANFEDGRYGDGTAEHPYELRKPIDLFYLAAVINDDYYGGRFAALNYKLMNDIDMDGEQLFVIGDNSTSYSAFCGTFDGGGHTISNFRITDEVYDQSTYELEYLPYVGLFGYAVATVNNNNEIVSPVIKNLTLENYSVEIHTASSGAGAYAGSLLGYGIGVEITGCKAVSGTGSITVINDNNQLVNVGGLVGRLQGAYGTTSQGTVSRGAFVRSSSAVVSMHGTGCPRSAGGIVGYLISAEESAIAYVVNCYSKGSVNGAMHSGGIVGTLGRFSTVSNCYSSAEVSADNQLGGVNVTNEYKGAYAGGIVGYAEENTVIAGCYAANYTSASVNSLSAYSVNGAGFMSIGAFAGEYAKPDSANADQLIKFSTDYDVLVEYNNATAVTGHPKSVFTSLGWVDSEWSYSGTLPEIVLAGAAREIKIKVEQYNNPAFSRNFSLSEVAPLSDWYKRQGSLPEYHENAVGRSWGYYFDKQLTKKAPYGFVPVMAETTLYAGYADYSEVEGTYYVEEAAYSNGAYIELTADGRVRVRNGGMYHECVYSYTGAANGSKIIVFRSGLAALSYGEEEINGGYFAYGGTALNGALSLSAYLTLVNPSGSAETGDYYVNATASLNAVKASESFVYGEYKDANGVRYQFSKNGSGVRVSDKATTAFTFVPTGNSFNITLDRTVTVTVTPDGAVDTIDGVSVSKIDEFKGSWKKTANGLTEFNFDGEGFVSMNGGEAVEYKPADGGVGFEIGNVEYKATFANGALVINGENYYKNDGFTGEWFMLGSKEQIQVAFDGIGTDGYGTAVINYSGGESHTVEAEYDVAESSDGRYLRIYVGDRQYGELVYNQGQNSAVGSFYSWLYERYDTYTFYLYDLFRGSWTAAGDDFDTVTFNGRSASADDSEVAVRSAGNVTTSGKYTLTDGTHGTMTVGGKTYTIVYDGATNLITFSYKAEGETTVDRQLGRRDSWYGVELTDGTLTYKFDGKSNVGGKVKVSDNTEYEYAIEGGAVTMNGMALTPDNDGFDWGGTTSLKFNTGFAGDWLISGVDNVLTIKEVSGYMTAEVSATGAEGKSDFVFDPAAKTLTLTEGETVTLIKLMGENEMSITRTSPDGNKYYNCLRSDKADSWKGVYTAEDGSSWKFDGLGSCRYGGGTAIYTPATGEPARYGYRINELGVPYIKATENIVFIEDSEGEYGNGGKTYKTVTVNAYYGRRVFTENPGGRTTYLFDGVSTLWERHSDGSYTAAYTYEIVTSVSAELIKDGVRYNGLMEEAGMSIRLTVNEQLKATSGGTTYAFGIRTLWIIGSDGSYEKAYTYTVTDEKNREYELTDASGAKFDAKLTENEDNTVTITIIPQENKTEQA